MNFALTWAFVRQHQGVLWLRIDDVDASRMRPEFVEDIFITLRWLGFDWDKGPQNSTEFFAQYSQNLKREEYRRELSKLPTYACRCSRQLIQTRTTLSYDGHCSGLHYPFTPQETSLRVQLDHFHDPIIWRKDDLPSYHLVSVLDDTAMGTTHIVRGEDLRESSELQMQLAKMMGIDSYKSIQHYFHPLITDEAGNKLSKSADASSLYDWRQQGHSAEQAWQHLASLCHWPASKSLRDLLTRPSIL